MVTTPDPTPTPAPTPALGEGPVRPVSVSLHEGTIAALKARTGKRGISAYAEAEHGPVDRAAVDAKRALLRGDTAGSADTA
ncbi:hypothetical protein ACFXAZ_11915 [Streptomyces sp. NPDC059477]|uniref:hypothetical protein n=1 Tax=Streptomyces sp. NPDC059477 TaxID=3346847 RepID=UPI0036992B27